MFSYGVLSEGAAEAQEERSGGRKTPRRKIKTEPQEFLFSNFRLNDLPSSQLSPIEIDQISITTLCCGVETTPSRRWLPESLRLRVEGERKTGTSFEARPTIMLMFIAVLLGAVALVLVGYLQAANSSLTAQANLVSDVVCMFLTAKEYLG